MNSVLRRPVRLALAAALLLATAFGLVVHRTGGDDLAPAAICGGENTWGDQSDNARNQGPVCGVTIPLSVVRGVTGKAGLCGGVGRSVTLGSNPTAPVIYGSPRVC